LPVENPAGLVIGCIPSRAEVRDTLISAKGFTLATLPSGAHVGTCSLRRTAQVLSARSDLTIDSLRGNVDSRVRKALAGQYDAIVLAGAGLIRLGLEKYVSEWLSLDVMLPAPGQGALAVQCRADDHTTLSLLAVLEDSTARKEVAAERQFLLCLGGGCALPVAAYAQFTNLGINLRGVVASPDGRKIIHVNGYADDPLKLGELLAQKAVSLGASQILSLASGDSR
jgi:hydroxymethylbilane synthase